MLCMFLVRRRKQTITMSFVSRRGLFCSPIINLRHALIAYVC